MDGLVEAITHRAAHPEVAREEGERARQAFDRAYARRHRTAAFGALLESVT